MGFRSVFGLLNSGSADPLADLLADEVDAMIPPSGAPRSLD